MILLDIVLLEAVRWAGLLIRQSLDLLLFCYIGWQMRMQENSTMYSMLPEVRCHSFLVIVSIIFDCSCLSVRLFFYVNDDDKAAVEATCPSRL
jgi:hypothetical protein